MRLSNILTAIHNHHSDIFGNSFLYHQKVPYFSIPEKAPEDYQHMFFSKSLDHLKFGVNESLALCGSFAMSAIIPYYVVDPSHKTLVMLAGHALRKMKQDFQNAREARGSGSELGVILEKLRVKRSPTAVTVMAFDGRLYIASSARAGAKSILSGIEYLIFNPHVSIIECLQAVEMWSTNVPDPVLHHQRANCGEMATMLLWAGSNLLCNVQHLKGARIVTVHLENGQVREFPPCRSCKIILDHMRLDYGFESLIAHERSLEFINSEMQKQKNGLAGQFLAWELVLFGWILRLTHMIPDTGYGFFCLAARFWLQLNRCIAAGFDPHLRERHLAMLEPRFR